jgi:hypothetical protein
MNRDIYNTETAEILYCRKNYYYGISQTPPTPRNRVRAVSIFLRLWKVPVRISFRRSAIRLLAMYFLWVFSENKYKITSNKCKAVNAETDMVKIRRKNMNIYCFRGI